MSGCLCGHGETCYVCDPATRDIPKKDQRIAELEDLLRQIDEQVDEAMGEPLVGARALINLRWARKLIARGLGQEDD